jgi:hypothetical protein
MAWFPRELLQFGLSRRRAEVERHHFHRGLQLGGKRPRRRQQRFFDRGGEHV